MHYGIIAPELHGHLNPVTTLGTELAERGHQITVLGSAVVRPFADRTGLNWSPIGDTAGAAQKWKRLGELSGLEAMRYTGRLLAESTATIRTEAPKAIEQEMIDALIVDQMSPAGAVVAEEMGLPYVVACNALAVHITDSVPPPR